MRVVLEEVVTRLVEKPFGGFEFEFQQRSLEDIAGTIYQDVAPRFGQIGGLVILQPVSLDHRIAPAQHRIAFHHGLQVRAP